MERRIPPSLRGPLADYRGRLERLFPGTLRGIYLHGSIALDAFDERRSDVDLLIVLERRISRDDADVLRRLHRLLRGDSFGRMFDGLYAGGVGPLVVPDPSACHPYFNKGRFQGYHSLRPLVCALLRDRGVVVAGDAPERLFAPVPFEAIREEMMFNLRSYWAGKARRPYLFLFDAWVDFAVTTLPRILHTLETGEIVPKRDALRLLRERFGGFERLIDDVESRCADGRSAWGDRPVRARCTVRLIRDVAAYADERYPSGS
jgi:hypothetical protein